MHWGTWSPFQSQTVKDICAQMTPDEKKSLMSHSMGNGAIVAIFFAIPFSCGVTFLRSRIFGLLGLALLAWFVIGVFVVVKRRRKEKELLCSTQWAKSQAITPDRI